MTKSVISVDVPSQVVFYLDTIKPVVLSYLQVLPGRVPHQVDTRLYQPVTGALVRLRAAHDITIEGDRVSLSQVRTTPLTDYRERDHEPVALPPTANNAVAQALRRMKAFSLSSDRLSGGQTEFEMHEEDPDIFEEELVEDAVRLLEAKRDETKSSIPEQSESDVEIPPEHSEPQN